MIGFFLALFGLAISIVWPYNFDRQPDLFVDCYLNETGTPSSMTCRVTNRGRGEATNIMLVFNQMLPAKTEIKARPEFKIALRKVETPPDPNNEYSILQQAFVIEIDRVPGRDHVDIALVTSDPDNIRTAAQILKIRLQIKNILYEFGERLKKAYPQEAKEWQFDNVVSQRIKEENMFRPGNYIYNAGKQPINYFTPEEILAKSINEELYKKYKKEFFDIYEARPSYAVPVVKYETKDGFSTLARFPPYISAEHVMKIKLPKPGETVCYVPQIPVDYNASSKHGHFKVELKSQDSEYWKKIGSKPKKNFTMRAQEVKL